MAGHSKFKNIMHRKGAQDRKRAGAFAKLCKEITVAARLGKPDENANPRLFRAVRAARKASVPKDRIDKAIAAGDPSSGDTSNYDEIRYEGYGPGGVAVIVEALTDNKNRAASSVRTAFAKNGGSLGETGAVTFMFTHVGCVVYPASVGDADTMFEAAVDAGADNVESNDSTHEVYTALDDLMSVAKALEDTFGEPESAEFIWKPNTTTPLNEDQAKTMLALLDALDDSDDVQNIYANYEIDETVMEKIAAA